MSSRVRYVLERNGRVVAQGPKAISILKAAFKQNIGTAADDYIKMHWVTFRTWSKAQLITWLAQNSSGGYTVRMYKEKRGVRGPRSQYWAYLRRAQQQHQQQGMWTGAAQPIVTWGVTTTDALPAR